MHTRASREPWFPIIHGWKENFVYHSRVTKRFLIKKSLLSNATGTWAENKKKKHIFMGFCFRVDTSFVDVFRTIVTLDAIHCGSIEKIALSASLHVASVECALFCMENRIIWAYETVPLPPAHHTLLISWGIFRFQWGRERETTSRSSNMPFAKRDRLDKIAIKNCDYLSLCFSDIEITVVSIVHQSSTVHYF